MSCLTTATVIWLAALGQYVPDRSDFLADHALQAASLQRYWQAELPLLPGDAAVSATLVDDALYVVSRQGSAVALHAPTGLALWARRLTDGLLPILQPAHLRLEDGPGPVVFVADRGAQVLDRLTGKVLADLALPFPVGAPAVGDEETLYLGSSDGSMYALQWSTARLGRPTRVWQVRTGGPIRSAPAFDGDDLLFASDDGSVYSCQAYNKVRNWRPRRTGGPISAGLVLHESGVYVASGDRSLYRLDAFSGTVIWRQRLPMPLRDDPVVAGPTVYQYSQQTGLFAIDIDTGRIRWHRPDARRFVARHADRVYVLSGDAERLLVLDGSTGRLRHSLDIFGARAVVTNPSDDAIYLVSNTNQAVCLRPADVPYLTFKELTAIRARLLRGTEAGGEFEATPPPDESDEADSLLDDPLRSRREISPVAGD